MKSIFLLSKRKGQSGLELIVMTILGFAIFAFFYLDIMESTIDYSRDKVYTSASSLSKKISANINIVYEEGSGFSKNITIPSDIYGANYDIYLDGGYVFVSVLNNSFISKISTSDTSGMFSPGKNRISNINGVINISSW